MKRTLGPIPLRTALLALAVVTLSIVAAVQRIEGPSAASAPIEPLPEDIQRILIEEGDAELTLIREGGQWLVGAERYPADAQFINGLLDTAGALGRVDIVSARGRLEIYGLDEPTVVRFFTAEREPLAIELGSPSAAGDGVYALINGAREVVVVPTALDERVSVDALTYRERLMLQLDEAEVSSVTFDSSLAEGVVVQRSEAEGSGAEGSGADGADAEGSGAEGDAGEAPAWSSTYPVEIEAIHYQNLFAELAALRATDFPEGAPGEPFATITVERTDGPPVVLQLSESEVDARVTVVASGVEWPFDIPLWRARRLLLGREEFVPAQEE